MNKTEQTRIQYNAAYSGDGYYWTLKPSNLCYEVLKYMPPDRRIKLLDIGCGEGRNTVFFARNGYETHGFDISENGLKKTRHLADRTGVRINTFQADLNQFRLEESFDVLFSTGTLHACHPSSRKDLFDNLKTYTSQNGLHVFSVFVDKPFIPEAPDNDANTCLWRSGELLTLYHDWLIESFFEEIIHCNSSGIPHQHAMNRIVARKPKNGIA